MLKGVEIHYFAAARAAAGTAAETVETVPDTLGELLDARASALTGTTDAGMSLRDVLEHCTFLIDGRSSTRSTPLAGVQRVDVLPPFAGG
ncbi:MoaD/ThiS family protein [Corynebacterium testudinoris]|uniref:Molybdopterin converting factor, small subunit n=1 Tax=Corynebacterium testudinoris TaxID=136857 RepID=A0A0G3H917_9CORY|nr:MoaD/ThiS family protein [Corynebacterium testudinoris]AKK07632.1 molybdopterin converting factor, small subunit [Corynebacterium testudinoris]